MRQVYHTVTDFNKQKFLIFTLSFLTQTILYAKLYYIFERGYLIFIFSEKEYNKIKQTSTERFLHVDFSTNE